MVPDAAASGARKLLSPSKVTAWLDCAHSLTLRGLVDAGALHEPSTGFGDFAQLLLDKGLAHEHAYLDELLDGGRTVVTVPDRGDRSFTTWVNDVGGLLAEGHEVLYQMPMIHDGMRGVADFLVRVERPSDLGSFSYEPVDAKLARNEAKPGHVLQLCFYADALTALQGVAPDHAHLQLGSGVGESIRLATVHPYWRRLRRQLARAMESSGSVATVAEPCTHCQFCEFAQHCENEWRAADALHYVAGIRVDERVALTLAGVLTKAQLSRRTDQVEGVRPERLEILRRQADLQQRYLADRPPPFGPLLVDGVPPTLLPEPDDGDVFLDYEGHPFWTAADDLFFLFGRLVKGSDGGWKYETQWAFDLQGEARITDELIHWVSERRERFPKMHVYHYNHTERSALQRLAAQHGAGEARLGELVERGVFVDVFEAVRRDVLVGVESYGLKSIEALPAFERSHDIDKGAGAVVEFEAYCVDGDDSRLRRIERYNEDDVRATLAVRDWLIEHPLHGAGWAVDGAPSEPAQEDVDEQVRQLMASGEPWQQLLAHLLDYWGREGRVHRALALVRLAAELPDQLADPLTIGGLKLIRIEEPEGGRKKLLRAVFEFPAQDLDPDIRKDARLMFDIGEGRVASVGVDEVDPAHGWLTVTWRDKVAEHGIKPTSMVLNDWVNQGDKVAALHELASRVLDGGGTTDRRDVAVDMLQRQRPRFTAVGGPPHDEFTADLDSILQWVGNLDGSFVAIQGPPGTGKTYTGSHIIHRLVDEGQRVGITAFSHNAIDNLVRHTQSVGALRVLRQHAAKNAGTPTPGVTYNGTPDHWLGEGEGEKPFQVYAGTTWVFAGAKLRDAASIDTLVIDEAGQLGLADAIAAMSCARNVILLGDPLQLSQVSQALHPEGSGASVLEHVLGHDVTIPPDRGVFLDVTRRMHPDITSVISELIYENRLSSHESCAEQSIDGQAGLRWIRAEHEGRSTESTEEAQLVIDEIRRLLGTTWRDQHGAERPLASPDVMVVAPYNDHVNLVRGMLDEDDALAAVRVGTVDRFQGQEAPVVFFTMASSSGADMPRGTAFLFSANRLNVAVSRARALAYIVCTDALLDTRARSVPEMQLIGTLCALVERAQPQTG